MLAAGPAVLGRASLPAALAHGWSRACSLPVLLPCQPAPSLSR